MSPRTVRVAGGPVTVNSCVDGVMFLVNNSQIIPQERVLNSLRLFAQHVMPAFRTNLNIARPRPVEHPEGRDGDGAAARQAEPAAVGAAREGR